jgi:hypothetical protein
VPALLVIWAGQERCVRLGNYAVSHAPAIFGEKISVATAERPELKGLMATFTPGDAVATPGGRPPLK